VQIEGTQGYGLGLHTRHYPQVTSSDCRAIDFMAMAGVSPWGANVRQVDVWVVYRPYPIRVAGNSGPLYRETTWEELGLPQEHTTVTQKVRRVGGWDGALARAALTANGGPSPSVHIAVTMIDQVDDTLAGVTDPARVKASDPAQKMLAQIEHDLRATVALVGTSDRTVTHRSQ